MPCSPDSSRYTPEFNRHFKKVCSALDNPDVVEIGYADMQALFNQVEKKMQGTQALQYVRRLKPIYAEVPTPRMLAEQLISLMKSGLLTVGSSPLSEGSEPVPVRDVTPIDVLCDMDMQIILEVATKAKYEREGHPEDSPPDCVDGIG